MDEVTLAEGVLPQQWPPGEVGSLRFDQLVLDPDIQARDSAPDVAVREYAEALEHGEVLPPLEVFHADGVYFVADGFRRALAHQRAFGDIAGGVYIPCMVRKGTREDAILFSVGSNRTHGERRTNADKGRAVRMALLHPKVVAECWGDRKVAELVGVAPNTVGAVREKLVATAQLAQLTHTVGIDHKVRPVRAPKRPRVAKPKVPRPPDDGACNALREIGSAAHKIRMAVRAWEDDLTPLRAAAGEYPVFIEAFTPAAKILAALTSVGVQPIEHIDKTRIVSASEDTDKVAEPVRAEEPVLDLAAFKVVAWVNRDDGDESPHVERFEDKAAAAYAFDVMARSGSYTVVWGNRRSGDSYRKMWFWSHEHGDYAKSRSAEKVGRAMAGKPKKERGAAIDLGDSASRLSDSCVQAVHSAVTSGAA